MQLMAWSLTREERAEVRGAFLELDHHHTGVIKLTELRQILEDKFHLPGDVSSSVVAAFSNLDHESDGDVHYSDFLAAMMSSRLTLHDDLLREAFRHFEMDQDGHISLESLQHILGSGRDVEQVFNTVDLDKDGFVTVEELVAHLRSNSAIDSCAEEVAHGLIDGVLIKRSTEEKPVHHDSRGLVVAAMRHFGSGFLRKSRGNSSALLGAIPASVDP